MMTNVLLTVLVLVIVLLAGALWWRRRDPRRAPPDQQDRLDTIAAWPPQATRVLGKHERLAFLTLTRALPDHMILAQVPLSRLPACAQAPLVRRMAAAPGQPVRRSRRMRHGLAGDRRGRGSGARGSDQRPCSQACAAHRTIAQGRGAAAACVDRRGVAVARSGAPDRAAQAAARAGRSSAGPGHRPSARRTGSDAVRGFAARFRISTSSSNSTSRRPRPGTTNSTRGRRRCRSRRNADRSVEQSLRELARAEGLQIFELLAHRR